MHSMAMARRSGEVLSYAAAKSSWTWQRRSDERTRMAQQRRGGAMLAGHGNGKVMNRLESTEKEGRGDAP